MIDAGRLAVYRWVAPLAAGRKVLDAGFGSGDGALILAKAGAREVVRLDVIADPAGDGVHGTHTGVTANVWEGTRLEYADASYQLVVAIRPASPTGWEHTTFDELLRVTAPDGLLLISAAEGRPADAARARLLQRFGSVTTARCYNVIGGGVITREPAQVGPNGAARTQVLLPGEGRAATAEVFMLAGDPGPQAPPPVILLDEGSAIGQWIRSWRSQRAAEVQLENRVRELEQRLAERDQLQARLRSARDALDARIATGEEAIQEAVGRTAGSFEGTLGWKLTAPLRRVVPFRRRRLRGS